MMVKPTNERKKEDNIKKFFDRYEHFFAKALGGELDAVEISSLYTPEFIAASPVGVLSGKNDDHLRQVMEQGYEYYRKIGTKEMRVRNVRISPIDELHSVAHVSWRAIYTKEGSPDIAIDFEVHYLMQQIEDKPQIFGWVSGDEQTLLREHGVIE